MNDSGDDDASLIAIKRGVGHVAVVYVVCVGSLILFWNAAGGGLIQQWYREYHDANGVLQGSGSWRIHQNFASVAFFLGIPVYPVSVAGILLLIDASIHKPNRGDILRNTVFSLAMAIVLGAFITLGLFTSVTAD